MSKISRRTFIKTIAGGTAALTANSHLLAEYTSPKSASVQIGTNVLGDTGLVVPRLAFGTGTNGWKFASNQTRMQSKRFVELAAYAYHSGIKFLDCADIYGSHTFVKEALKTIPRDDIVLLSKIWTRSNDWLTVGPPMRTIDRFRKELGTDTIDILLIHCQVTPNWLEETKQLREFISELKEKGVIKTHGVSCHTFEALQAAAASDWVEVLLARINHTGSHMDNSPDKVMPVLKQAHDRGAGVLGMKIFGVGDLVAENQRQAALEFSLRSGNIDAMTIGFESEAQIDDTITRINTILAG